MSDPHPSRRAIARAVSIVLHPFVTLALAVSSAASVLPRAQLEVVLGALLASLLAIAGYVVIQLRRGAISNIDVSRREQRPKFFAVAIGTTVVSAAVFRWLGLPERVEIGTFVSAGLLSLALIVNTRIKASLHVAYTVFAVGIAWQGLSPAVRAGGPVLIGAMVWSRVEMRRHTLGETLAGAILGLAAAVAFNVL